VPLVLQVRISQNVQFDLGLKLVYHESAIFLVEEPVLYPNAKCCISMANKLTV